jgi:sorbitol-specific phosphotransferase system component IIBC
MNLGLRAILLIVAIIFFIIAIFSDTHAGDWLAAGLAVMAGAFVVEELGVNTRFGTRGRRT